MGAFAGSSAMLCREISSRLSVITLTVNNRCNLKCPHCYLQYDASSDELHPDIVAAIAKSSARCVVVVGMEPLVTKEACEKLEYILSAAKASGKQTGFITNGLNTHFLTEEAYKFIDWVDVSVDGTPSSYPSMRSASWQKLTRGIQTLKNKGFSDIRLLQTLTSSNINELREMLQIGRYLGASRTVLSPFCTTRHQGRQEPLGISASQLLDACRNNQKDLEDTWLVMETSWFSPPDKKLATQELRDMFDDRTVLFEDDPIYYGMIRLTYEGQLMTPRQAMHTMEYSHYDAAALPDVSPDIFFSRYIAKYSQTVFAA